MQSSFRVLAVALGAPAALAAACGGSDSHGSPADAGADATQGTDAAAVEAGVDALADHGVLDANDGGGGEVTVVPGTNFAFRHYYLGDTDRAGASSASAWQLFGVDVDGKATTASSTDVCTLTAGAAKATQADGPGGIDNSWGANLMPIWETIFGSTVSTNYNAAVDGGAFTTMIDVAALSGSASQSGAAPGWGFVGASFGGQPTWTQADDWPVYPDWLVDGSLGSGSKIAFPAASIDAGTWSSGTPTDLPFQFGFGAIGIGIVIHHATASFVHTTPSTAAGGNIGGVLDTQEFVAALENAAGWISSSLCQGSAIGSITQQVQQAQDILLDGSSTAGQTCNAISIGLGFDGVQIGPVQQVTFPEQPLPNICPEAGGD
jgi:hypothetical protein